MGSEGLNLPLGETKCFHLVSSIWKLHSKQKKPSGVGKSGSPNAWGLVEEQMNVIAKALIRFHIDHSHLQLHMKPQEFVVKLHVASFVHLSFVIFIF